MSQLSQQELAEFFDLFTTLSAKNLERLSSPPIDAVSSSAQVPMSTTLAKDDTRDLISSKPLQTKDKVAEPNPPALPEPMIEEYKLALPANGRRNEDITHSSNTKPLAFLWEEYTRLASTLFFLRAAQQILTVAFSQAASVHGKIEIAQQALDRISAINRLRHHLVPLALEVDNISDIRRDARKAVAAQGSENLTESSIAQQSFLHAVTRWGHAVGSTCKMINAPDPFGPFLAELKDDLNTVFLEVCTAPFGEVIEAMEAAINGKYTQMLPHIDTFMFKNVPPKLVWNTSEFHDRNILWLKDVVRNDLAKARALVELDLLIGTGDNLLTTVGRRASTTEEGYELVVNLAYEHMQPSLIRSVDYFTTVSSMLLALEPSSFYFLTRRA